MNNVPAHLRSIPVGMYSVYDLKDPELFPDDHPFFKDWGRPGKWDDWGNSLYRLDTNEEVVSDTDSPEDATLGRNFSPLVDLIEKLNSRLDELGEMYSLMLTDYLHIIEQLNGDKNGTT